MSEITEFELNEQAFVPAGDGEPAQWMLHREIRAAIRKAWQRGLLPRPDRKKNAGAFTTTEREAILDGWASGLSVEEISAKNQVSGGKPRSCVLRALERARRENDPRAKERQQAEPPQPPQPPPPAPEPPPRLANELSIRPGPC